MLKKEFKFYRDHQKDLLKKHRGKYIVIKGQEIIGVYTSFAEALEKTSKTHEPGTFLVQFCSPGKESYTQEFRSRVVF